MPEDPKEEDPREGHRERLRERFRRGGLEGFLPHEALELALTWAIPRRDVKGAARELVARFGGVFGALTAREEDLSNVEGLGPRTALFLRFLGELSAYALREKAPSRRRVDSPAAVIEFLRFSLGGSREENFLVLFLNARNELLAMEVLQTGTVDHASVYPRKVVERALAHNAVSLILVHNHPSGHDEPSPQDIALTRRIAEAAQAVDMQVHDHLVVTRDGYSSLRELGLLKPPAARPSIAAGEEAGGEAHPGS
jgi:DNA repair protein RadC